MALSLDSSSFYYGGVHGHHAPGHGHDQGGYLQYAVIPGLGGHDVYGGHPRLMDQQSAAAMAASLFSARTGGGGYDVDGASGGYDVNGAGASVPSQGQPHPSMSSGTGSQSSTITMQVGAHAAAAATAEYVGTDGAGKKRGGGESTGERRRRKKQRGATSQYHGVHWCTRKERYEARICDNSYMKEGQTRKRRQVRLGYYDNEEKAARAYDLAALKYRGKSTHVNFPVEDYKEELVEMENMSKLEYVAHLKRKNSRGKTVKKHGTTSQYHGVSWYQRLGRYVAQIRDNSYMKEGQTRKGREVHLGYYDNEEKAARVYDVAALKYWGKSTHLNFPIEDYKEELVEMDNMSMLEYVHHLRRKNSRRNIVKKHGGTSQYRGVYWHRQTGRYEVNLWDNSYMKEGQTWKGRRVYVGLYDNEEKAAGAYDLAALKCLGKSTHLNFSIEDYKDELVEMEKMSKQEYVAHLKRKSSSFLRRASKYRGVYYRPKGRRWQAQLVANKKFLNLGTFTTQEQAAEAFDMAAIKIQGLSAVTNFDITRYDVDKIMKSNAKLPGDQVRHRKARVAGAAASDADAVARAAASLAQGGGSNSVENTSRIHAAALPAPAAAVARADEQGGGGGGHHQQQQHHHQDLPLGEIHSQLGDIVSLDAWTDS